VTGDDTSDRPPCGDYRAVLRHLLAGEPLDLDCADERRRWQREDPNHQQRNRARMRALGRLKGLHEAEFQRLFTDELMVEVLRAAEAGEEAA
jgi:hypothetical protein